MDDTTLEAAAQVAHEIGMRHALHGYTAAKSRTGRDKANAAARCALDIEDAIRALLKNGKRRNGRFVPPETGEALAEHFGLIRHPSP